MKRLRITVDGTPYDVTVEEIETAPDRRQLPGLQCFLSSSHTWPLLLWRG
ncbi:hypothetical protein JMK10_09365 [Rhodovulum sulfidophilum]|nr:hypothetical protein [Rhodovulum sulfidophilum]MCF4117014.1 hypothetical protein [Rhodovulum sulfidophilum]